MTTLSASAAEPRRRLTAARRRRQLIDVALETFARSGYNSTTMEDIATAAGVTKPLLYQHFMSKRALYLELIDDVTARLIEALGTAAGNESTFRRKVEAGMYAYFHFTVENQSAVRMLYDAPHDEELARGLRSIQDAIAEYITPLFLADIDDEHRRTLAIGVVGMAEGVTRHWLRQRQQRGPAVSLEEAESEAALLARRVADVAWNGLRAVRRID